MSFKRAAIALPVAGALAGCASPSARRGGRADGQTTSQAPLQYGVAKTDLYVRVMALNGATDEARG